MCRTSIIKDELNVKIRKEKELSSNKITVFWDLTPRNLLGSCGCIGGTQGLSLHNDDYMEKERVLFWKSALN
jgi:hypothetical protein